MLFYNNEEDTALIRSINSSSSSSARVSFTASSQSEQKKLQERGVY
jgi:hypothetical protein